MSDLQHYTQEEVNNWLANKSEVNATLSILRKILTGEQYLLGDIVGEFYLFSLRTPIERKYKLRNRFIYFARSFFFNHLRQLKEYTDLPDYLTGNNLSNPESQCIRWQTEQRLERLISEELPRKQAEVVTKIVQSGDMMSKIETDASKYNTFKANYRHAVTNLKKRKDLHVEDFFANI